MEVAETLLVEVLDASQVGEARRKVLGKAAEHGLDQKVIDRAAIVASELATNLIKHADRGILLVQGLTDGDNIGLELLALDKGPGMRDVQDCVRDGFSTTGTMGTGLGAISRMSESMEIASSQKHGTVVQARLWNTKKPQRNNNIGGLNIPLKGELVSGDNWVVSEIENGLYCLVVDGLGHGFEASEASRLAVARFRENLSLPPAAMIKTLHQALRGSRGAVGAVARIDFEKQSMTYCGLGNITGILIANDDRKHLTSLNGTLGYESRKILEFNHLWINDATLVMHSDGLSSKVSEDLGTIDYKNTAAPVLAGMLYQHHAKKIDDATVIVVKQTGNRRS